MRWLALAVLAACLSLSAYYRHRARSQSETIPRRREGAALIVARLLGAMALLGGMVTHVVRPDLMTWASFPAPGWLPWAGALLGLLTIPAVRWVFVSLGRNVSETVLTKQDHELVATGPYRWVRHPLYTTGLALILAVGLMLSSWVVLLLAGITLAFMWLVVIPVEERELLARFGDRYRGYAGRTGRLLPRLTGGR